jgi:hypothetical protein
MAGRIVLYGATGYMGELAARAMVVGGARPVLAGRNQERLKAVASRLSRTGNGIELDTAVVGTERPEQRGKDGLAFQSARLRTDAGERGLTAPTSSHCCQVRSLSRAAATTCLPLGSKQRLRLITHAASSSQAARQARKA